MQDSRGNFLLQALLALTLIFLLIPFFAEHLAARDMDAKMFAATQQIETAQTAARIFIKENANALPYNQTVVSGDNFSDLLEPYGLPLGFVPKTAFGQDISLVIDKTATEVSAYLKVSSGGLSELQLAELARRIGFYAAKTSNEILVGLALDSAYSDVVRRNEKNLDNNAFLADLEMNNFTLENFGSIVALNGEFDTAEFDLLSVFGSENGRKEKNSIENMVAERTVFQTQTGESALSLTRGVLVADTVSAKTISKFGDTGSFTSNVASVYDFSMTAGSSSFAGPADWTVKGNLVSDKINFSVEKLEIKSFINASRGQDVFINPDSLDYSSATGIDVGTLKIANITMRDQTSDALLDGETGAVVLDIRPAGTSVLPDVLTQEINNDALFIIDKPTDSETKLLDCKSFVNKMEGRYNKNSLSQYIVCQYLLWNRLEQRIDAKRCLLEGRSDCD